MIPFPISEAIPATHTDALPETADVVVIGGGVIGVMTAYWLAKAGTRVVLAEKGRIAGEQSSRNWGWIRQQGRDPAELPIMIEAARHWRDLAPQLDTDIGLKQGGVIYLGETKKNMAEFEAWMPFARAHGVDTRLLSRAELADHLPGARGNWHGGLYTASDMRAEPWLAVPALARLAAKEGAVIRESCAVRALDVEAGRVAGVVTELGRIRAPAVVVAGGAWSRLFLQAQGVHIPQLSVRATVGASNPLPLVTESGVAGAKLAFRRRADGGYTFAPSSFHDFFVGPDAFQSLSKFWPQLRSNPLGTRFRPAAPAGYPDAWRTPRHWDPDRQSPFERIRVLNPTPNRGKLFQLQGMFARMYPTMPPVRFQSAWAGMIDTMPDVVPVIGPADGIPGLTIATGLSGHGFGIGPGIGRVVADLVMGRDVGHDLHRFRLSRFSDGSRLDLGPGL